MAKVIRNRWVFRTGGKWYRYLPRRNDAVKEYDFESGGGSLDDFRCEEQNTSMDPPSKLWMAWVYRDLATQPKWTKERIEKLFGKDWEIGKPEVFMNTEAVNQELWHIKHLIELKPIRFPNGEPTINDLHGIRLNPDGVCNVAQGVEPVPEDQLRLFDETKQWSAKEISQQLDAKYYGFKDVFERNVYTSSKISQLK
ncbi:unnamed protein product [Auanema sp. JU1783]|nr:unnamed protein product [Auanema sp. JU1783]